MEDKREEKDIEEEIIDKKKSLRKLTNLQYENILFSKSVDNCVKLLRKSAKGEGLNRRLNNISEDNERNLRDSIYNIEEKKREIKKSIKDLQDSE